MPGKKTQLQKLQNQMSKASFWDNSDSAQSVVSQLSVLKSVIVKKLLPLFLMKDIQRGLPKDAIQEKIAI